MLGHCETKKDSAKETLERILAALEKAANVISTFVPPAVKADRDLLGRGPVTETDRAADRVLRGALLREGEGWLSEESPDDLARLEKQRVWVVDPLDGTLEFLAGIPEWCVSIGLVENGRAVAGGVRNPATGETFLGFLGHGLTYNGRPACAGVRTTLEGATVLASRSEVQRGEWEAFRKAPITVQPTGSIAYKLARVAAGLADATWTLTPKHEWDVAAGVALVHAAGGFVECLDRSTPTFNNRSPLLSGLIAGGLPLREGIRAAMIAQHPLSAK
jgi:myo-inositol-1(or 4)-monophosphatase